MTHRRDQNPGPLTAQVAGERSQAPEQPARAEVHHAGSWRQLAEEDPIGRRIRPGGADDASPPWHTVVGVVGEVHHLGARQGDIPIWYRSVYQDCWNPMSLAVRTTVDPAVAVRGVKATVARIDPQQPIYQTRVMTEMVGRSLSRERFSTNVLMAFAGLAPGLAAIGIFGVTTICLSVVLVRRDTR